MTTTKMPVLRTKNSIDTINLNTTNNSTTNITLTFPALHMNNNVTIYNLDGSVNSNFNVSFPIELTMDNVTFSRITLDDAQFNYEVFYTEKINTYSNSVQYQNALSQSYMNVTTIPYTAPPVFAFANISFGNNSGFPTTVLNYIPFTVQNTYTVPTNASFPLILNFNSGSNSSYFADGFTNVAFYVGSSKTILTSSVEYSSTNATATFLINIPNINANDQITIFMGIASTSTTLNPNNATFEGFNAYHIIQTGATTLNWTISANSSQNNNTLTIFMYGGIPLQNQSYASTSAMTLTNQYEQDSAGDITCISYGSAILSPASYSATYNTSNYAGAMAISMNGGWDGHFFTVNFNWSGSNNSTLSLTPPVGGMYVIGCYANYGGTGYTWGYEIASNTSYISLGYNTNNFSPISVSGSSRSSQIMVCASISNSSLINVIEGSLTSAQNTSAIIFPTNSGLLYFEGEVYNTATSAVTFTILNPDGSTAYSLDVPANSPPETFKFYSPNWIINNQYVFTFNLPVGLTFNYFFCRETY